jgi:hypothetical protein
MPGVWRAQLLPEVLPPVQGSAAQVDSTHNEKELRKMDEGDKSAAYKLAKEVLEDLELCDGCRYEISVCGARGGSSCTVRDNMVRHFGPYIEKLEKALREIAGTDLTGETAGHKAWLMRDTAEFCLRRRDDNGS